jgi:CDP-paratose 2-epimerase
MMKVLVTGCAGFIGSHVAEYFLKAGSDVFGIDNLSRKGAEKNLNFLSEYKSFEFYRHDIRDFEKMSEIFKKRGAFELIFHEAAQVAVTTSVVNPKEDFEINALGTLNLLEATRLHSPYAFFEFSSTNKVYGKMGSIQIAERDNRYEYANGSFGIDENYPLDFYSPYGCSKGAADQYVRDYSRIYGLKTVVLRQSCIYGTRQFGVEDQGWIAWFIIGSLLNKPLTIYGDGKQIRDVLWIEDLVDVYVRLFNYADQVSGGIFNIGGGPENTLSLLELVEILEEQNLLKREPAYADWRPGDQKVFVCDVKKACETTGWNPTTRPKTGVKKLVDWAIAKRTMLEEVLG